MREILRSALKRFLQNKLIAIKKDRGYTQEELSVILSMDRRSVAALLQGESMMGGLSVALYFTFLSEDSTADLAELKAEFLRVLSSGEESAS